jgi:hypothetical protein
LEEERMHDVSTVDLDQLPKLAASELRLLWVNDWYDGPLEAVVEHERERCLMVLHSGGQLDTDKPMKWVLFHLSAERWKEEERWHELFEVHVGHHWCFHHDPPLPEPTEARDSRRFYDPYAGRKPRELDLQKAVGWVDEMPAL